MRQARISSGSGVWSEFAGVAARWLRDGCEWLRDGCEWRSRASGRISRVRKRVEGVACDEGEMAVHLRGDGEEGELRCSERVGVSVESGYYGSVRAEAMMAEAVRLVLCVWRQVRGVEWRWLETVKDASRGASVLLECVVFVLVGHASWSGSC